MMPTVRFQDGMHEPVGTRDECSHRMVRPIKRGLERLLALQHRIARAVYLREYITCVGRRFSYRDFLRVV